MVKTQINRVLIAFVLFNLCVIIGCHRGYYRRQADAEARRLILEKSNDPRWSGSNGEINVDPQSRMFSPFSADHPPIPPDDASSHQLMHVVDGKEGYPQWHVNGDTNYVENPEWLAYLPINENGQAVLTLDRAFQLALLHSPRFQQQRETLYLSALDVSLQRFGFDTQLFAGFNSFMTTQGRLRSGSGLSRTTLQTQVGANGGGINFQRLGITGANFAVGLANTILFNFAGADTKSTTSLIDFSIIQPLLRGAGRDRIMESLTQSERTLLADVRQMERFRRGFYLEIATGRGAGGGPGINFLSNPGSASINAGGYLGLLQTQQQIRNQELNVRQLDAVMEQFREFFASGFIDAVGLKDFETNYYGRQRALLDIKISYQSSLDRFKAVLGLPPTLDVIIDDSILSPFELISDEINDRLIAIGDLREVTGTALNQIDILFDNISDEDILAGTYVWPPQAEERLNALIPYLETAEAILDQITTVDREQLERDFAKLESVRPERLAYLHRLQTAIDSGQIISGVDPSIFEPDSIPKASILQKKLSNPETDNQPIVANDGEDEEPEYSIMKKADLLKTEFQTIKSKIAQFHQIKQDLKQEELPQYLLDQFLENIPGRLANLKNLVVELSILQAEARSNSIEIIDVDIQSEQAIRVAACMRRDWMNARAALVDSWRNIEFVADQLEAQVDLIFQGDMGNTGSNPLKLRYETGQLRAGFRFDSPIVRLSERNQYRRALISYNQTRRQFYQFEDSIKQNLRFIIRNIDRTKVQYELDRRSVQIAIETVEVNRLALLKPVGPNQGGGQFSGATSRNLTTAINSLNQTQDSFLSSWVQSEVLRLNLDFDMGTMQLDDVGQWLDPGVIDSSIGIRAASIMGIEIDCQFCNDIGTPFPDSNLFNLQETGPFPEIQPVFPVPDSLPFESTPVESTPVDPVPEQPTTEPDPVRLNPPVIENQPLEVPVLTQPQSGMLAPQPNSPEPILTRVPRFLFQNVTQPAVRPTESTGTTPIESTFQDAESQPFVDPLVTQASKSEDITITPASHPGSPKILPADILIVPIVQPKPK